jgi:hypothetical protein
MKRSLTLSEGAALVKQKRRETAKGDPVDAGLDPHDWRPITKEEKAYRWAIGEREPDPFAGTISLRRSEKTLLAIFLAIFSPSLMASLAEALKVFQNLQKQKALPQPHLRAPQETISVTQKRAFKVWGLRIYMQATAVPLQRGTTKHGMQNAFETVHEAFATSLNPGTRTKVTKWNTFSFYMNRIWFPLEWIRTELSAAFSAIVNLPSYFVLDEKLKRYTGNSPCLLKILSKPDQLGHWISEVCVRLAVSALPFCCRLFPITSCTRELVKTRTSSIVEWATLGLKQLFDGRDHTLVADSYYLDRAGRKLLLDNGAKFLVAVKKRNFKCLADRLPIEKGGKWHALYNETTGELFVHVFDSALGHKYLLTNALSLSRLKAKKDDRPGWDEYKFSFNVCDQMNLAMADHYWPFRRSRWELGIDDSPSRLHYSMSIMFGKSSTPMRQTNCHGTKQ